MTECKCSPDQIGWTYTLRRIDILMDGYALLHDTGDEDGFVDGDVSDEDLDRQLDDLQVSGYKMRAPYNIKTTKV